MCRFSSLPSASEPSVMATSQSGYSAVGQKSPVIMTDSLRCSRDNLKCSLCRVGVLENFRLPPSESRAKVMDDFGATSRL